MPDETDHFVKKMELVGRAKEDQYFRKLDEELTEKLRRKADEESRAQAREAERRRGSFAKILVAVDFSPCSRRALEYAGELATRFDSAIIVLHVIDEDAVKVRLSERHPERPFLLVESSDIPAEGLESLLEEQREKAYDAVESFLPPSLAEHPLEMRVLVGHPFERIVETADNEHVGLVVMGTHGRRGVSRWLAGSIAERVMRQAPCPVLTVKLEE